MLVIDASAVVELLVGGRHADWVAGTVRDEVIVAPELIDVEIASALARLQRTGLLGPGAADAAIARFETLPIDRLGHAGLTAEAWALRDAVRIADAFYVAAANALDCLLITTDARLGRSGVVRALLPA
ncbi:type II toxin-antitoxin system VapC family toxin [Agromyces sp. NPDC058484]|uniref:type II toxin-antitoxin system VapC family toxin n=1 Tax=Agromyces sp. NPDC058484 TaxID=3346524 RepID=UPI003667C870